MKVLADTNILVSAFVFPDSVPAKALQIAGDRHSLILCRHIISKTQAVIKRKWPDALENLASFFELLPFILVKDRENQGITMSGPKDLPILDAAMGANADIIISGDRHFLELAIERPKIMMAREFCEKEGEA